jgi:hypothetical protein
VPTRVRDRIAASDPVLCPFRASEELSWSLQADG